MNSIQVFRNEQFGQIRTAVTETGEPLFCLADVCTAAGLTNPSTVRRRLDDGDVQLIDLHALNLTSGVITGNSTANFVSESGFYDVLFQSSSPKVQPFQKWVTHEVLPALRKTGGYMVARTDETPEQIMARAVLVAQDTLKRVEEQNRQLQERVSQQDNALQLKDDFIERQQERLQLSESTIKTQAPKVKAFEEMMSSEGLITINKIALDFGVSAIRMNRILCEKHIQYKEGGTYLLYSKYRDMGIASLRSCPYLDELGNRQSRMHLYWTERGRLFIHKLMGKL
jgi:prophage antirepressor-like protein